MWVGMCQGKETEGVRGWHKLPTPLTQRLEFLDIIVELMCWPKSRIACSACAITPCSWTLKRLISQIVKSPWGPDTSGLSSSLLS